VSTPDGCFSGDYLTLRQQANDYGEKAPQGASLPTPPQLAVVMDDQKTQIVCA
jgi:hypothetical protein